MMMKGPVHCFAALLLTGLCSAVPAGREFATTFMQNFNDEVKHARFQIEVTAPPTSQGTTDVTVTALGKIFKKSVEPGKGVIFLLPDEVEMRGSNMFHQTVLIKASQEVTVVSLNYKEFTADTSVLYPINEWGTEYYVFTPPSYRQNTYKEFAITNHQHRNPILIFLRGSVTFQGKHYSSGSKLSIKLEPFESVQIQSQDDLSGSKVISELPVGVLSGHTCAEKFTACNHVYEQLLPVKSWGKEFIIAPLHYHYNAFLSDWGVPNTRGYDSVYVQASENTTVTKNIGGNKAQTFQMHAGQTYEIKSNWPSTIYLTSDKRIQVLFEFNGGPEDTENFFDPFLMNILPTNQFSVSYALDGQEGFNNLVILVARSNETDGIKLDNSPLPSNTKWSKVDGSEYSFTVLSTTAGFNQIAHHKSPFGAYSFGTAVANGYGSAASANEINCRTIKCQNDEECKMTGTTPICVKKPPVIKAGTCWVMGDPHYRTFDGHYFNLMGTCTYTMAKNCHVDKSHPAFEVEAKNENHAGSKAAVVGEVIIKVYGYTITIVRSEFGLVRMNYTLWNLPINMDNGKVRLFQSGLSVIMETDFGLIVQYDWKQHLVINVPGSFAGKVCGLCGNFNSKDEDDMTTPSGSVASSTVAFGKSWRVPHMAEDAHCSDECTGKCESCANQGYFGHLADRAFCGLLTHIMDGPFRSCSAVIEPKVYHENCLYDVCMGEGLKEFLCDTLQVYSDTCQRAGVKIHNWRRLAFCPAPSCPENSHYEFCGEACPATCDAPDAPSKCKQSCVETCTCDEGYLLSGTKCVPKAQCGCNYHGRYIEAGHSFWANERCTERCTCNPANGQVHCKKDTCGSDERCEVKNGVRSCQHLENGICTISGDPHYNTFDNGTYDFQGTCTYTAAKACHLEDTHLNRFSVVVENEKWTYATSADPKVSVAKLVSVEAYEYVLILRKNQTGLIMVNGVQSPIPMSLNKGAIKVYQEGTYYVILTDFGLRVTYDMLHRVTVTVPGNYRGKTCGLCGNFNGNKADEFQLPDGTVIPNNAKDILNFGAAWKVSVPGVVCEDGCSGDICPKCDSNQKAVFEQDCKMITDASGPFAACHSIIDAMPYYRDCVYDVCQANGASNVLCQSISAYMTDCQTLGVKVNKWRNEHFCPLSCPANSHYQACAETCDKPCPGLKDIITCTDTCAEGCACNDGNYFNGTGCVSLNRCSCYFQGRTYMPGESMVTDDCQQKCTCTAGGQVQCEKMGCGAAESCEVKNHVRGCYPKQCVMNGGLFTPFNGEAGSITVMGAYEIIAPCEYSTGQDWFRVVVSLQECTEMGQKSVLAVYVFLNDMIVTVTDKHDTWVNGRKVILPSLRNNLSVKAIGKSIVIEKSSSFRLSYSRSQQVTVTVNDSMVGKVCGACGNIQSGDFVEFAVETMQERMAAFVAQDFPTC